MMKKIIFLLLLLLLSLADATTNRINEITTNGTDENLIVNASGSQIIFERNLNLTEDLFWDGLIIIYANDTGLWVNASDQDTRIIAIEDDYLTSADLYDDTDLWTNASDQDAQIQFLLTNATDQDGRIISLEGRPLQPNIDAVNVTSGTLLNARMNDTWLVTTSDCSAGQVLLWPSTCVNQWAAQPNIDWANITTGTAPQLNIDAANITAGTILNARYNMTYLALASDVTNLWTNATNQDAKFNNYLPLAGGSMTGILNMTTQKICMTTDCTKYIMANTTGLYFIT